MSIIKVEFSAFPLSKIKLQHLRVEIFVFMSLRCSLLALISYIFLIVLHKEVIKFLEQNVVVEILL